ncbi:MAG: hypothetical protein M1834_007481 [Cirrosporium novae-zelandiae]|nr:MAG: hypothetical protein M1834_007481 [Cirrosporium novae-zelandiae]
MDSNHLSLGTLVDREAQPSMTYNWTNPNPTILPYTTGLSGVHLALNDMGSAHMRHLVTLGSSAEQQTYFSRNHSTFWPFLKKHLLYAPLGKKRHNREIQLSTAINIGTLPSRFHTCILLGYLLTNIAYCLILDYKEKDRYAVIAELRGRSGTLAVVNMVPLFVLAGRNNPLIPMLRVSFDTYNLLHRWMGRMVVFESCVHTLVWAYSTVEAGGWGLINHRLTTDEFSIYGMVGTAGMVFLSLHSISPLRHAFYETFLHLHQLAAIVTLIGVWIHIEIVPLPQVPIMYGLFGIWGGERFIRFCRVLYLNLSRKGTTKITVEAMPGETCRVTCHLPKRVDIEPGSHVYLYLPTVSLWMSHPFSVGWVDHNETLMSTHLSDDPEKDPISNSKPLPHKPSPSSDSATLAPPKGSPGTSISLLIAARTGMTRNLYNAACDAPRGTIHVAGSIEGPYCNPHPLRSYGTVVLFAAGVGITHQLPYLQQLLNCYEDHTCATKKILLVWTVRSAECLEWVRPWMDQLLALPHRREVLRVQLFVTKPRSPRDISSPSATVMMFPGRPNSQVIIEREAQNRTGAMCVTVCGPGAFADEVRDGVRKSMGERHGEPIVDFVEEAFTW